ncbi:hypothetical protein QTP70_004207 [Hemibagrus guttatus]|uniref:AIG1-type G domain-containing protein n=1 Tax=Hemibagrus guttatus TaxID=175788 RepID=A0AAE0PUZ8_9TELE|nr:hypothetical protein QTP70_004207 [Hemibagrus guttatus]
MLYDCRNDSTVPGMMLWDREEVVHNKDVDSQHNTEFTVATSDTIEEKANQLKVDGELKLSLLGGNVNLSGAARYFNDTKKSFIQQRLTLHYRTTTRFEQLTMNHLALGQIGHHEVFDHDVATHVVIAVLYGADAYFLFDKELNLSEETTNEQGGVKIAAEKLKILCSAGAQGELNMNEKEKAEMKQLNCTFYGDFKLPSNPTTFEDAVKVYNDLPKMLGENGEHAVPVRVWLYPLVKLDPRAAKFQRNISTDVIRAVESVIESLNVTSMKCGDLMEDTVAKTFNTFHDRVQDFQKLCVEYKQDFMKKLGSILPEIRGGNLDQPENHKDESQMDQSLSNNAAKKEIQPSENAAEQRNYVAFREQVLHSSMWSNIELSYEACKENAGKLEDFKKEIAEMKLFGLPKNNEVIIGTELRLVLLGRDESDKTAAKNIILGGEEINQSTATATQQRESTQVISGMKVIVVDTPDLLFSGNSLEKVSQTVEPKAFVLVIPVKYLEDKVLSENETQMTLMKLEEIFGTGCWRNTMIIFTVSDELQKKKIEKFIRSGDQEVRRLLEKCENRFHCLSIKESGNGSQVLELLEKIEKMVEGNRNGSPIYQNIRNMEMERHAKDAWIRKMQIQIQKALEKCEQFDEDYEKNLKTLGTGERSAPQRKMFNHMRNQNKLKKVIAEQMKMIYDRVAELEENGQFIKVQQTIWLSLPDEETKTIEKYTKLRQLEEKFLKIMGNAYFY